MIIFSNSLTLKASALVFNVNSLVFVINLPPPIFTFSRATIVFNSEIVIPNLFNILTSGNIFISLSL